MPRPQDSSALLLKLQQDTMQQLEAIAAQVDAGQLSTEEGRQRAQALLQASDAERQQLHDAITADIHKRQRRWWLFAALMVAAMALIVVAAFIIRSPSAA